MSAGPRVASRALTSSTLHRKTARGRLLPEPSWRFSRDGDDLVLRVTSDARPLSVRGWSALASDRDFRDATWESEPCPRVRREYACRLILPEEGFGALFAELTFPGEGVFPLRLSTIVRIESRR